MPCRILGPVQGSPDTYCRLFSSGERLQSANIFCAPPAPFRSPLDHLAAPEIRKANLHLSGDLQGAQDQFAVALASADRLEIEVLKITGQAEALIWIKAHDQMFVLLPQRSTPSSVTRLGYLSCCLNLGSFDRAAGGVGGTVSRPVGLLNKKYVERSAVAMHVTR